MNETRKAIIEIIEPHMDKTLSEGCLLINNRLKSKKYSKIIRNRYGWISFISNDSHSVTKEKQIWFKDYHKILWHYDITAVLKYIDQTKYDIEVIFSIIIKEYSGKPFWNIPIKPLSLYTEAEEKDLLELLLKLK